MILRSAEARQLLNSNVKRLVGDQGQTRLRQGMTTCQPWVAPLLEAVDGNELELAAELAEALELHVPRWRGFTIQYAEAA